MAETLDLGQPVAADYREAHASRTRFDDLLGQRFVRKCDGDQSVGGAEAERRTTASQAVYEALEEEKAAPAALRRALEAQ